ncbi:putative nuclear transport factor 2 [Operophtera brumata]|uniref:Putative nuclear transport factor 2 n=1 Tax=Operophtera brumata TaxID=104452 RepID=A0A0L7L8A4_OPEBR|nr:putative nuclear transport factor 2 [Operophtera brumata]
MALNPQYDAIGKGFVQQYYILFDDPAQRPNLVNMYNVETSFMTFEGVQLQGAVKIMEKLNSLTFQKIGRVITSVDSQPMFDGGTDDDAPHAYLQTFVLKPIANSFYVEHDIFRLALHDCDDDPPHPYMQTFVLKPLGDSFFVQHDIFRLGIHDIATA